MPLKSVGNKASLAAAILGCSAIAGQIILLRELMILFYGNELSTGIVLMTWLIWTALGSYLGGNLPRWVKIRITTLAAMILSLSIILPLSIVLSRISKTIIGISQGEIIGIGLMIAITAVTLLPLCLISGTLFPITIKALTESKEKKNDEAGAVGRIYLMEAVGSSAGGIVVSLVLIRYFGSLEIAFMMSCVMAIFSAILFTQYRKNILLFFSTFLFFFYLSQFTYTMVDIDGMSRKYQWRDFDVIDSVDTIYGNLTVTAAENQVSIFDNGVLSFTYPDLFTSEEQVSYPLILHPDPKRVLLVGGGISSSLSVVLRHPSVEVVDYVELDPKLIELGKDYLPNDAVSVLSDPRVNVINIDGRFFIKGTNKKYDVVIVNVSDPINARINRYYTLEFTKEVKAILTPGGIFAISATSSEEIIGPPLASFLASVYRTIDEVFAYTAVIPGGVAYFVASDSPDMAEIDPQVMISRLGERGVENKYVSEYYLPYKLTEERLRYIKENIDTAVVTRINTDLEPISYLYDMILWSLSLSPRTKISLVEISRLETSWMIFGFIVITILYIIILFSIRRRRRNLLVLSSVAPCVLASGFTEISLEVVIIVAFQTFYGYVYYSLGLIVTAFMIGLAIGSFAANRTSRNVKRPWAAIVSIQGMYSIFSLLLVFVLISFSSHYGIIQRFSGLDILFSLLNFVCGILGGLHFIYTSRLFEIAGMPAGFSGGWIYGTDLFGSSFGALISSVVLIPVLGLVDTALFIFAVNILAIIAATFGAGFVRTREKDI